MCRSGGEFQIVKNIQNYNVFCKVGLPKTVISMKNIRNFNVFRYVGLPKTSKSIKNIWNYNAFDDLACLRPTMRSPGAPQETPKASQDPFKPPTLYIETPDQPQSGRYLYISLMRASVSWLGVQCTCIGHSVKGLVGISSLLFLVHTHLHWIIFVLIYNTNIHSYV